MEYKGYIAVDYDATLSRYLRPWVYNKFGKLLLATKEVINSYYDEGYHINIWTGRLENPELYQWLKKHGIKFHTINVDPKPHPNASRFKPYMNLGIDDKMVNPMKPNGIYKNAEELKNECDAILKLSNEGKEGK